MPLVWLTFVSLFRRGKLTFAVIRSFESLLWMWSCQSLSWPLTECCQSCYYSAHSSTVQAFSIQLCPLASVWAGRNAWNQRVRFLFRCQEKQHEMSDWHGVGGWSDHRTGETQRNAWHPTDGHELAMGTDRTKKTRFSKGQWSAASSAKGTMWGNVQKLNPSAQSDILNWNTN